MKSIHSTFKLWINIPSIGSIDDILQLCLSSHQLIHLTGITIILFKTEFHIYLIILLQCVIYLLNTLLNILFNCFFLVKRRILRKIAYTITRAPYYFTLSWFYQASNDFHQCWLTCTIKTDNTDFSTIEERKVNVLQNLFLVLGDNLRYTHHWEDNLLVVYCRHLLNI